MLLKIQIDLEAMEYMVLMGNSQKDGDLMKERVVCQDGEVKIMFMWMEVKIICRQIRRIQIKNILQKES